MITPDKKTQAFCNTYRVSLLDDSKRCIRHIPNMHSYIANSQNGQSKPIEYGTEPLLTIQLPKSKFEAIVDTEATFYNNIQESSQRHLFQTWMQQQQEEKYLRQKNAAVKLAYEQYHLLLNMCKENPNKLIDLD